MHKHTHTPLTPSLTHPKPCQEHLCKMEKQTRRHKEALSKRPREEKSTHSSGGTDHALQSDAEGGGSHLPSTPSSPQAWDFTDQVKAPW